jgi:hypothetical protein
VLRRIEIVEALRGVSHVSEQLRPRDPHRAGCLAFRQPLGKILVSQRHGDDQLGGGERGKLGGKRSSHLARGDKRFPAGVVDHPSLFIGQPKADDGRQVDVPHLLDALQRAKLFEPRLAKQPDELERHQGATRARGLPNLAE